MIHNFGMYLLCSYIMKTGLGNFFIFDHYKVRYICIRTELTGHNVERRIYCCKGSQILFRLDKNFRWTIILICSQLRKFGVCNIVQNVSRIDIPMLDYYLHSITVRVSVSPFIILTYCSLTSPALLFSGQTNFGNRELNREQWSSLIMMISPYLHISLFLFSVSCRPPSSTSL